MVTPKKNRQAYSHKMLVLWTPDDILYYSRHSTTNPENRYALETHLQLYLFTSMLWYRDGVFPSPTLKTPSRGIWAFSIGEPDETFDSGPRILR